MLRLLLYSFYILLSIFSTYAQDEEQIQDKIQVKNYEREIKRNFSEIVKDKLVLYLLNLDDN